MEESFIQLVRLGVGHCADDQIVVSDWNQMKSLAERQGLSAIVVDGIDQLPENQRPSKELLLEWIGEVLQGYEYRYESYKKIIADLAGFYNSHGYQMMVFKGYACSLDWPKPEHRPCGDIDIWQFGQQKRADKLVASEKSIKIDTSHHHHSIFTWGDFTVENHYDFINIYHHKSNKEIETILKEKAMDDSHFLSLYGEKIYLPSPDLHALFLLKHLMMHFAAEGITLRQILDWAFFAEKHNKEINWEWLLGVLNKYGMMPAFQLYNAICVEDLGFDASLFPPIKYEITIKERVIKEIFSPEYDKILPKGLLPRTMYKIKRWKGNSWKHELCYNESMWSAFWSGVWGHLLKPKSI